MPGPKYYKIVFVISCFIAGSFQLHAQGFKKAYTLDYSLLFFSDVLIENDTVVISGMARKGFQDVYSLILLKMDTLGNVLWLKQYQDSLGDDIIIEQGYRMTKCPDGGYALVGNLFYRDWGVLVKTDYHGNLEFIREYNDSGEGIVNVHQRKVQAFQDGFIIAGSKQTSRGDKDAFVIRTDLQGNRLWEWRYDDGNNSDISGSLIAEDSIVYLGGGTTEINDNKPLFDLWRKSWIKAIAVNGEDVWSWSTTFHDSIGGNSGMNKVPNEGWIYLSRKPIKHIGWTGAQGRIVKLRQNFEIDWVKTYGDDEVIVNGFTELVPAGDGNWIAVGQEGFLFEDGHQGLPAWIMKINANGDSLWSRHDTVRHVSHYLSGVAVLPSGSTIAVGYTNTAGGEGIVIKTDKDGCIEPGCRIVSTKEDPGDDKNAWQIYPNPARDVLYIESGGIPEQAHFTLLDLEGKVVLSRSLDQGSTVQSLSLRNVHMGVYVYRLQAMGVVLHIGKLVVQ